MMTVEPLPPEPKPTPTPGEAVGMLIDDLLKRITRTHDGVETRFGTLSRELAVVIFVAIVGMTAFILALLFRDHEFAYSLMINLTTEMIGAGLVLWLVHSRLSGLSSEEERDAEDFRKEIQSQLDQIKQSIDQLSKQNPEPKE